ISFIGCARNQGRPRLVHFDAAKKSFCELGLYLNDLVRNQAVRLAMHLDGGFGVRRIAKTKNLPGFFVYPIFVIMNAVLVLAFNILGVSFGDILGADSSWKFVNVHV